MLYIGVNIIEISSRCVYGPVWLVLKKIETPPFFLQLADMQTLRALTQNHSRNVPVPARALLMTEQRKVNKAARDTKKEEIDLAVQEWFANTVALAEELAVKHSKKPRHFLDLFFQGGARMLTQRNTTNSWNAWSSITAAKENNGNFSIH